MTQTGERDTLAGKDLRTFSISRDQLDSGTIWNARFLILELVGSGGTASVYRATNLQMQSTVALKIMHRDLAAASGIQRFMKEARLLSALNHPGIVKLHSFGQSDTGVPFMALEFVEGTTLAQIVKEAGAIEPARAVAIACQICHALEVVRESGIVHRDVKPANVIISVDSSGEETAKLIDFGIAGGGYTDATVADRITKTDALMGSPAYMSPEQCAGKTADSRSDIYAVGCILYEMLCGRPPFQDNNAYTVMSAHINQKLDHVAAVNVIPSTLEQIVLQCLQKDPDARYGCAHELEEVLAVVNWDTGRLVRPVREKTKRVSTPILVLSCVILCIVVWSIVASNNQHSRKKAFLNSLGGTPRVTCFLMDRDSLVKQSSSPLARVFYYRSWLEKFAADNPDREADAYFYLGRDLCQSGLEIQDFTVAYARAGRIYRRKIDSSDNSIKTSVIIDAYENQALIEQDSHMPALAVKTLESLLKRMGGKLGPPRQAQVHHQLAMLLLSINKYADAETHARESVSILQRAGGNPWERAMYLNLEATCLANQGSVREAGDCLKQADVLVAPILADGGNLINADWCQFKAGALKSLLQLKEALEFYKKGETLSQGAIEGMFGVLTIMNRWTDVAEYCRSLLSHPEKLPEDCRFLPVLLAVRTWQRVPEQIDLDALVEVGMEKCLPKSADNRPAAISDLLMLAYLLQSVQRNDLAGEVLLKALAYCRQTYVDDEPGGVLSPYCGDTFLQLASGFIDNGDFSRALELLNSLDKQGLGDSRFSALALRAVALSYLGSRAAEAREAQVKLLAVARPDDPLELFEAQLVSAWILRNLHDNNYKMYLTSMMKTVAPKSLFFESSLSLLRVKHQAFLFLHDNEFADEVAELGIETIDDEAQLYRWLIAMGDQYSQARRFDIAGKMMLQACNLNCANTMLLECRLVDLNSCVFALESAGRMSDAVVMRTRRSQLIDEFNQNSTAGGLPELPMCAIGSQLLPGSAIKIRANTTTTPIRLENPADRRRN